MYKYEHGGAVLFEHPDALDFSANINPLGLRPGIAKAITNAIDDCTVYPDSFSVSLRKSIAEFDNVPYEHIICSNGASDLIFRLASTLKPKKALVLAPTFSDYERALLTVGCEVSHHMLYQENDFEIGEDIVKAISSNQYDMVFICNPNNPTGCVTPKGTIKAIIEACQINNCFAVIDECFMDFVPQSGGLTVKPLTYEYKNMMVVKAFTKIFSLAGVRLGYGICSDMSLLDRLYQNSPDWSVSVFAQSAGIAALQDPDGYLKETIAFIQKEKEKLIACLKKHGFIIYGSRANYIFFKSPYSFNLKDELFDKHNIFIRSCDNYNGLNDGFYRVGIQPEKHNDCFCYALEKIAQEGGFNG